MVDLGHITRESTPIMASMKLEEKLEEQGISTMSPSFVHSSVEGNGSRAKRFDGVGGFDGQVSVCDGVGGLQDGDVRIVATEGASSIPANYSMMPEKNHGNSIQSSHTGHMTCSEGRDISQEATMTTIDGVIMNRLQGPVLQRWRHAGLVQGLVSDAEIASFLLDMYEDPPCRTKASESSHLCTSCHTPLTLVCLTCNPAQTKPDVVDIKTLPTEVCDNASDSDDIGDQWEDINVSEESGDILGSCFVKVEDIASRTAVARLEKQGLLSPVAAQLLKAARSRGTSQVTGSKTVKIQKSRMRNSSCRTEQPPKQKQSLVYKQEEGGEEQHNSVQILENVELDDRPYRCSVCSKAFKSRSHCRGHEVTHKGEKLHKCDLCSAAFYTAHNLRVHHRTHTGERPFFCEVCHKSFARSGTLKRHRHIHSNNYPYSCETCGKKFVEHSLLLVHCRKEHTLERPFTCDKCEASFVLKRHLSAHMLWHSSQRPFLCEECGASFKQKAVLNMHKRIHQGVRPFSCDVCGQSFYRMGNLRVHKKTHLNIRDFMCTVCGAAFVRNNSLKRHMQKHTGFRPYKCGECEKAFALKFDLKKHMSVHSGDKPFTCDICGRLFALMGNMKKHRKRRHKLALPYVSTSESRTAVQGLEACLLSSQNTDNLSSENHKSGISFCDRLQVESLFTVPNHIEALAEHEECRMNPDQVFS